VIAGRCIGILLLGWLLAAGFAARDTAWAQTCGAHGTGKFLCSAGSCDGRSCESFDDCPDGICVTAQGVCNDSEGEACGCPASTCSAQSAWSSDAGMGSCADGTSQGEYCVVAANCGFGVSCIGAHKICINGDFKGFSCLNDQHCTNGSVRGTCASTGKSCEPGTTFAGFTCVDDSDCCISGNGCPASCARTTIPTATQSLCTGDCDQNGAVTVDELLAMVNAALGNASISPCTAGDPNDNGQVTVDEILAAVTGALDGCPET